MVLGVLVGVSRICQVAREDFRDLKDKAIYYVLKIILCSVFYRHSRQINVQPFKDIGTKMLN